MSVFEKIYFIFDVNSVSSTYSLYKITNGDDQKVTKNTIYCEICIICPQIGKWSILYITVQMFAEIFSITHNISINPNRTFIGKVVTEIQLQLTVLICLLGCRFTTNHHHIYRPTFS